MAILIKRGKTWTVIYNDATGKQKWVKGYTDKKETERLANRLEDEKTKIKRGDLDPIAEARKVERLKPITQHIESYRSSMTAAGLSDNHISYTIADIQKLVDHSKVSNASAITWGMVDSWVISRIGVDTPRTINRRVGSVQAFLRHLKGIGAVSEYVLHKYPKQRVKGTEKRKRRALTVEETILLLATTPEERNFIYCFALRTGFRYSEIASMSPASFNFDALTVTVRANDAKNKLKDQTVPLHTSLVKGLKRLCKGKARDERIFVMPSETEAAKLVREDCKRAGVDPTHVDFHALRHTFITQLAQRNIHPKVLQALARHASIETTLSYYTHFQRDDERAAIQLLAA